MFKRLLFLLLIPLLFCCTKKRDESVEIKPTILVTIAPYAHFVEKIAGSTVDIQTLIPPGINIHIYEPTPKLVEAASKAKIWFRIDELFEKKIGAALKEINPTQVSINLQEKIDLLSMDEHHHHHHEGHLHEEERDLHTWLSPKNALKQAETIYTTLVTQFPENGELYTKNFNSLRDEFIHLDSALTDRLAPYKHKAFLISHAALAYFSHDYDLVQLSVEAEGKEPLPKHVEQLLTQKAPIQTVFLQEGYDNRGAQILGEKLNLPIHRIDPYSRDYFKTMNQIAEYIADGNLN